jgi:hypothetical protein
MDGVSFCSNEAVILKFLRSSVLEIFTDGRQSGDRWTVVLKCNVWNSEVATEQLFIEILF